MIYYRIESDTPTTTAHPTKTKMIYYRIERVIVIFNVVVTTLL